MTNDTPTRGLVACASCRGMAGHERGGFALDACDSCGGSGERVQYQCEVELLAAIPCHARMQLTARFAGQENWGCANGHRFTRRAVDGEWQWARIADYAALGSVVA